MTFDTVDWGTEAKRIMIAFGVQSICEFLPYSQTNRAMRLLIGDGNPIYLESNIRLDVVYHESGRSFTLSTMNVEADAIAGIVFAKYWTELEITWHGLPRCVGDLIDTYILAKGIYNLKLLTPEVVQALKVDISAHDYLEWQLEFGNLQ